jgi:hypothetical protein
VGFASPTIPPGATPPAAAQEIIISGSDGIDTAAFSLPAGNFQVVWTARNKSRYRENLIIEVKPVSGSYEEDLVDLITQPGEIRSGSTFIYNVREGQYYLEVLGDGNDWSVTFKKQ